MTLHEDGFKATDMTFYELENYILDLRFQIETLKDKLAAAQHELASCRDGDELNAALKKLNEKRAALKDWRLMAGDLYVELKLAQSQLDRFQIGVSPNADSVISRYQVLREIP